MEQIITDGMQQLNLQTYTPQFQEPLPAPSTPYVALVKQMKGHTQSVMCLSLNNDHSLLISGSEDGTARLWDTKRYTSVRCLAVPHGHMIFVYDIRRPEIILREHCSLFDYNAEEVNQLAISEDGKLLAACDDTGEVKIVDLQKKSLFKTLTKRHLNVCTSVLFRPGFPSEVITGGLDCNIVQWSINRGRSMYCENLTKGASDSPQTFNPPMVHCMTVSPDGKTLAAGLGDGSVAIYSIGSWNRTHNIIGHSTTVAAVDFAAFSPSRHLFSGSNDSTILLWDLTRNPKYSMHEPQGESPVLIKINHSSKINWMISSVDRNLFVADQSNDIPVFALHE